MMKAFIVHTHAEPNSFNGALFQTAQDTLRAAGHRKLVPPACRQAGKAPPTSRRNTLMERIRAERVTCKTQV